MHFKDFLVPSIGGSADWVATPVLWSAASTEDVARAAVYEHFHFDGCRYETKDIWQDPMATKICQTVGTSLIALKNRDFQVDLYILPEPLAPASLLPEGSRFLAQQQEVSSAFFDTVTHAVLQDRAACEAIEKTKDAVPKARQSLIKTTLATIASGCLGAGVLGAASIMMAAHPTASLALYLTAPIFGAVWGSSSARALSKISRRRDGTFHEMRRAIGEVAGRHWVKEALKEEFLGNLLITTKLTALVRTPELSEFEGPANDKIKERVYAAEDRATDSSAPMWVFRYQGRPSSPELGTTTIAMVVSHQGNDEPAAPPRRWVRRPKVRPEWNWLPKPAPARA